MEYLITRPARNATCPTCHHPVIVATTGGITTRINPAPLTTTNEITALLNGQQTYDVHIYGIPRRVYIHHRGQAQLRSPRTHPVTATHECKTPASPHEGTEIVIPFGAIQPAQPPY